MDKIRVPYNEQTKPLYQTIARILEEIEVRMGNDPEYRNYILEVLRERREKDA